MTALIPHSRIRSALRKLWLWSPQRRSALKRAKWGAAKGHWRCELCHLPTKKPDVDHVVACGATPGSKNAKADTTWDLFIARMFTDASGLRVLCKPCHKAATAKGRKAE